MARPASGTNLSIAQLQRVLNDKQSQLNKLHRQRTEIQKRLNQIDREIARVGGGVNGLRGIGGGGRARNAHSLLDTLESVLTKNGKPMKVGDIMDAVLAPGYRSNSENFRGIINQTLIKDKRFASAGRGIYEMKSKK
jgi:hypothetical protein